MMKFNLHVFSLVSFVFQLVLVTSHAIHVPPEVYWNSMMPTSPMPKALKDILYTEDLIEGKITPEPVAVDQTLDIFIFMAPGAATEQLKDNPLTSLFFLENDMHQGGKMNLVLKSNSSNPNAKLIVSRQVANSIPFSSDKLPQIYQHFSLDPNSKEANFIKEKIRICEVTGHEGDQEKYCATSLESMIDFSTSKLGNKVMAISTDTAAVNSTASSLQTYIIQGVPKKLASNNSAVVCHKEYYAYAVFYCHKLVNSRADVVSLVNAIDGTKVKAVSVCHYDTSKWNPKRLAFQVLKVSPGTVVCHFVPDDSIVWVPY